MNLNDIHQDTRGNILTLTGEMKFPEVTIFKTRKGCARGGCIHEKSNEYTCVIEGSVEYFIGSDKVPLKEGESLTIPRNTPHYYVSLTDSIVLEWGATPEEKKSKHAETRAIVDKINANA